MTTIIPCPACGDDLVDATWMRRGGRPRALRLPVPAGPHAHPDWATWEIGYVFDPREWGHGYATEACQALIDLLFGAR